MCGIWPFAQEYTSLHTTYLTAQSTERTPHTANDCCVRTIPAVAFIDKLTDEMMDGCGLGR